MNELDMSARINATTSGGTRVLGIPIARARLDGAGPRISRPGLLVAALLAASFLAACSSGGSQPASQGSSTASGAVAGVSPVTATSAAPAPRITPGHATPQDAVDGSVQAVFQGNWILACSYASPGTREACLQGTSDFGPESGKVAIDGADINGDYALVEVIGTVCNKTAGCVANFNPSSGMPKSPSDFQAAYNAALPSGPHRIRVIISPLPVIKMNGQWYLNYG